MGGEGPTLSGAPVAQLDRASGFYPDGCRFESCQGCVSVVGAESTVRVGGVAGVLKDVAT